MLGLYLKELPDNLKRHADVFSCQSRFRSELAGGVDLIRAVLTMTSEWGIKIGIDLKVNGEGLSEGTGTLVDPQTEELASGHTGLNNRAGI